MSVISGGQQAALRIIDVRTDMCQNTKALIDQKLNDNRATDVNPRNTIPHILFPI